MERSPGRVSVVVVDDHPLFRDGIVRAIKQRPDLEFLGEAGDAPAALALMKSVSPDVAVVDVRLGEGSGIELISWMERDALPTRVLVLSAFTEGALVYDALAAGASSYISKTADRDQICDAIGTVSRGEAVVPSDLQSALASQIHLRKHTDEPLLSPREREVLALTAQGYSAREIGEQLSLSPTTVRSHLQSLYSKLRVTDRAAAVAEGMRRGLVA
jgi:two-component system nitrate/nitrite response regulator NarL